MWSEVNKKREICILGTRFFLLLLTISACRLWSTRVIPLYNFSVTRIASPCWARTYSIFRILLCWTCTKSGNTGVVREIASAFFTRGHCRVTMSLSLYNVARKEKIWRGGGGKYGKDLVCPRQNWVEIGGKQQKSCLAHFHNGQVSAIAPGVKGKAPMGAVWHCHTTGS